MSIGFDACIEKVRRAFPLDDVPSASELIAADDIFFDNEQLPGNWVGRRWDEIDEAFLEVDENIHGYIYFTPRAFNYYLPALLMDAIGVGGRAMFIDNLVMFLASYAHVQRGRGSEGDRLRWQVFTRAQLDAIASSLRYYLQATDADEGGNEKRRSRIRRQIAAFERDA